MYIKIVFKKTTNLEQCERFERRKTNKEIIFEICLVIIEGTNEQKSFSVNLVDILMVLPKNEKICQIL